METLVEPKEKVWTADEYLKTPEGVIFTIIDGKQYIMPSPFALHQDTLLELVLLISNHIKKHKSGHVYIAPFDVILASKNVVQPDLIFISNENKGILQRGRIFGSPDVLIEIISPTSVNMDRVIKMKKYLQFKVPEYWIIDPVKRTVEIFCLENNGYNLHSIAVHKGKVESKRIKGFKVKIEDFIPSEKTEK
ncbi:MAG TPA: Uma2 family endonuclease [Chitinophagales bacterium]|nr:Uma2 family endonuclease [Chitinophagales bacterium]